MISLVLDLRKVQERLELRKINCYLGSANTHRTTKSIVHSGISEIAFPAHFHVLSFGHTGISPTRRNWQCWHCSFPCVTPKERQKPKKKYPPLVRLGLSTAGISAKYSPYLDNLVLLVNLRLY